MTRRADVLWFTGLSGAGKSTLAGALLEGLQASGKSAKLLDGDHVRASLHRDLGFSREHILENGRRMIELCAQLRPDFDCLLVAMISPFRETRDAARAALSPGFHEIHLDAPLDVLRARDVKGLYAKADRGELKDLIGVTPALPYERPRRAELVLKTADEDRASSLEKLKAYVAFAGCASDRSPSR